jgi:hypothetical protein
MITHGDRVVTPFTHTRQKDEQLLFEHKMAGCAKCIRRLPLLSAPSNLKYGLLKDFARMYDNSYELYSNGDIQFRSTLPLIARRTDVLGYTIIGLLFTPLASTKNSLCPMKVSTTVFVFGGKSPIK